MNGISIRHAVADDADIIAYMLTRLAEDLGDSDIFRSDGSIIRAHGFGAVPMFHCQIAQGAEKPLGLALYFPYFSTTMGQAGVYVQDLWVAPDARGAAIGRRLLTAVSIHAAEAWAATCLKLTVYADNDDAARFYDRLGFTHNETDRPLMLSGDGFSRLMTLPK